MTTEKPQFSIMESIEKHIALLRQSLPERALLCIGEYPIKILLKDPFVERMENVRGIFIDKSSEDIVKWSGSSLGPDSVLGLGMDVDTHFWFNVLSFVTKNEEFIEQRRKSIENLHAAVIVASSWDGVGSALMPSLISQFKALNVNSLALAILPSKVQPSDVHFNALSSMGLCVTEDFSPIILTDRDLLESFVGVNRDGSPMAGNIIINYLLELMLTKGTLVQEISELSRSFNVKMYTVLLATGASLKMYDSLENILNSSLSRPLLTFELSSASVLYVLIRMPLHLKDKLPRGKIELRIANWFKEKASLKSIYVTEPIYVDDYSDRIDIAMFVGGFNATERFTLMEKKVKDIKTYAIKKGFIKEDEWQGMIKNLIEE